MEALERQGHHVFIFSFDFAVIRVIPKCSLDIRWGLRQHVTSEFQSRIPSPQPTSIRIPKQAATVLSMVPHEPDFLTHKRHRTRLSPGSSEPPCLDSPPLTVSPQPPGHCFPFLEAFCTLCPCPSALLARLQSLTVTGPARSFSRELHSSPGPHRSCP